MSHSPCTPPFQIESSDCSFHLDDSTSKFQQNSSTFRAQTKASTSADPTEASTSCTSFISHIFSKSTESQTTPEISKPTFVNLNFLQIIAIRGHSYFIKTETPKLYQHYPA
ncbi:hypothetical protein BgiBS90_027139 [Biomphalaria glabrata]|nr:hypothetical protein BgiBS90_027139 [Biomphalaria glabrata]